MTRFNWQQLRESEDKENPNELIQPVNQRIILSIATIMFFFVVLLLADADLLITSDAQAQGPAQNTAENSESKIEFAVPGINDKFVETGLSVSEWIEIFGSEDREVYAARHEILKAMKLKRGMSVADIGAGTGVFSVLFARRVGKKGSVFAVETSSKFYDHLQELKSQEKLEQLRPVLSKQTSVNLPTDTVDCVFVCDTLHHFEQAAPMMKSIFECLRKGGALIVVDFDRIPGESRGWILEHILKGKGQIILDIEECGFEFVGEVKVKKLKENYFLRFKKL